MDPLAHTLVGAALAETGLKRLTRYATAALLISANLPDIDAISKLWGWDHSLYHRRGLTHGVLAMLILPLLLTGGLWLWHRWRHHRWRLRLRAGDGGMATAAHGPPLHLGWLLALGTLGVWSHPLLDWLNTYGVRLLMPFDERWFYGDTLFIIDPWLWLLAAAGVVMAWSRTAASLVGWVALGAATTLMILGSGLASLQIAWGWVAGLAFIAGLRGCQALLERRAIAARAAVAGSSPSLAPLVARTSLAMAVLYVGAVYSLARASESLALTQASTPLAAQSNPVPGNPFAQRLVLVHHDHYEIIAASGETFTVPRQPPDDIVKAALASPSIRGFAHWMRFPSWEVNDAGSHWRVTFRDLRYQGPDLSPRGIGLAEVSVPKEAVPTGVSN